MIKRSLPVEEICDRLRPVFGEKIDQLYFQYTVASDREEREDILSLIYTLYLKNLNRLLDRGVLLEPPKREDVSGTYSLAEVSYAGKNLFPFKLREKDWQRHLCVTGMSGSGKTTLAFHIVKALNEHKKSFLVFDWKKSFRPLMRINSELVVFTVGDEKVTNLFKTNINRPPSGVSPREWINVLVDLLVESFLASFGVHKVLLETLDEAFKEWGVYDGSENYPTWNHIKWRLEEKEKKTPNSREAGWLESALRIATVLTFGDFGKVINYKGEDSISIEDLLDRKVVMELNSLGNIEKKFFCEYVLTYIYKLKKARQNTVEEGFDHAIIVDEAHNIFLKKPTSFSNESVTDMVYREMREYGTSLICLDQHISKISDTVKGNSACIIAFQQQLPADLDDISRLMQLQDTKNYFSSLQVGEAIVKLAERYTSPFLVKVPDTELRGVKISSEEIKSRVNAVMFGKRDFSEFAKVGDELKIMEKPKFISGEREDSLQETDLKESIPQEPKKPSINLDDFIREKLDEGMELSEIENFLESNKENGGYTSAELMEAINRVFDEQVSKKFKNNERAIIEGLSADEQKFVEFLRKNPNHQLSTVELYEKIGLSPRKGTKIKKALEERGLLKVEEIRNERGWKKIIRLSNS